MSNPALIITDGTDAGTVDLLKLFNLVDWIPSTAPAKGGGFWRSSPFLQGRQLLIHEYDNITDSFTFVPSGAGSHDQLIRIAQDLRRLLEKAVEYWTYDWSVEPVWIEARGFCETETRYAVIHDYKAPSDGNPYGPSFVINAVFENWSLILEHGLWQDVEPLTTTDIETGQYVTYDGRNLGDVDSSGALTPTTSKTYVGNKLNMANLSDVYVYDAGGPAWTGNLMDAALPYNLLPAVPAVNDAIYFGCDTALADSGPFCSLIFDVGTAQADVATLWEYWDGAAWSTITKMSDITGPNSAVGPNWYSWQYTGVWSAVFEQPSDWATGNLLTIFGGAAPNITGYWIRNRVVGIGAAPSAPTQQNRDIYSVTWPYIDIQSDQLPGDIPYLLDQKFAIISDDQNDIIGVGPSDFNATRLIVGARTLDRGENFCAYINIADEQNTAVVDSITLTATCAYSNIVNSVCGRCAEWTPAAAAIISDFQAVAILLDTAYINEYIGRYRAFIRVQNTGSTGDFSAYIAKKELAATSTTLKWQGDTVAVSQTHDEWELMDLGIFNIEDEMSTAITIVTNHLVAAAGTLQIQDLVLMPVDEFAIDTYSNPNFDATHTKIWMLADYTRLQELQIFSASKIKKTLWSTIYDHDVGFAVLEYDYITNGKYAVNDNKDIRLWHLSDVPYDNGTGVNIKCGYGNTAEVLLSGVARYLSMRGDR